MIKNVKITKVLISLLVIVLGIITLTSCGGDNPSEKIGLDRIKEEGKLVLGFTEFPPFGYLEDNEYKGFDLELAKLVCDELGVELVCKYIDWDAQVMELQENVDCIWNAMTITEKRKENMVFTKPYWETNLVAVVLNDSSLTSVDELVGKVIAVEANGTADINLSESKDYTVEKYTKVSEALLAVKSNKATALVADATYVNDVLAKYSGEYKVLNGNIGDIEEYGIAFRKTETDLRDEVDKIIDKLYAEGKIDALLAKYFGDANGFKRD